MDKQYNMLPYEMPVVNMSKQTKRGFKVSSLVLHIWCNLIWLFTVFVVFTSSGGTTGEVSWGEGIVHIHGLKLIITVRLLELKQTFVRHH